MDITSLVKKDLRKYPANEVLVLVKHLGLYDQLLSDIATRIMSQRTIGHMYENLSPETIAKIENTPFQELPPEILEQIGQYAEGYETFLNVAQTRYNFPMTKEQKEKIITHAVKENNIKILKYLRYNAANDPNRLKFVALAVKENSMKVLKYLDFDIKNDNDRKKLVVMAVKMNDPEFLKMLWLNLKNKKDCEKIQAIAHELHDYDLLDIASLEWMKCKIRKWSDHRLQNDINRWPQLNIPALDTREEKINKLANHYFDLSLSPGHHPLD